MSALFVDTCRIDDVKPHGNADRLDIAVVKGWQCVIPKGTRNPGDLITYIPIDSVMPVELSDRLGVTKYLSKGRVRAARLRGEPSYGVLMEPVGMEGENVADVLGITKYIPSVKITAGDAEAGHPLFHAYTDIENLRNFPSILIDGEEVVITEKIHGTNCRVGLVRDEGGETIRCAGSKGMRRKPGVGIYWSPWELPGVVALMDYLGSAHSIILFGELYGKVQSLKYGVPQGVAFRAFDLAVNAGYHSPGAFDELMQRFDIPKAPVLYSGPFSLDIVKAHADGKSTIPGADNIREGVVIRPANARHDPTVGRVIMKYISDEYLCSGTEDDGE